jgi:hypothetical protein
MPPPPPAAVDQEQVIAYWTTEAGWSSELQLRNNARSQDLTVTPALRLPDGRETPLAPVTIKPQDVKSIDIAEAVAAAATPLLGSYGSVVLRFRSPSLNSLYAAMMIHSLGHAIAFHIDASAEDQETPVGTREGVWWLPKQTTNDYLVLTNQGGDALAVDVSLYNAAGQENRQKIMLGAYNSSRLSVRTLLQTAGFSGTYGGIKVSASAHAGSLDTVHFIFDENANFSSILKMFSRDPNAKVSERDFNATGMWTLRAPMLALSNPDPALAFPQGVTLQPQLFVRNATGKPATASLRFNWRSATTTGKAAGPQLRLLPYETRRIDVSVLQDGKTLPKDANWASVTLVSRTAPDEVVAVAASYDETLKYGAQTPFSDQLSHLWKGGMWEVDAYRSSIITAGNGGTKPTLAALSIFYNQGTQKYELRQTLQPDEQMWIDLGKLIREHRLDKNGNALPPDLTSGSYELRDLSNTGVGTLFEGKITYDKTYGHAAYGCATCCGYNAAKVFYDPIGVALLGTADDGVWGYSVCEGDYEDTSTSFYYHWNSAATSIVTVDSYGTHTGQGVGSTTSNTSGQLESTAHYPICPLKSFSPAGQANVTPRIDSISPAQGPIGTTVAVTLSGDGFGSTPTVSAGTGISVTVSSHSGTQIQASFAISASASGGNHGVSVTAGGQTSPTTNFYVQIPTSLSIISGDTSTPEASCTFTSGGQQYTGCGLTRSFTYQVNDQLGDPIQSGGLAVWDAFGTVSPNPLNIGAFNTTCTPANTGPCGVATNAAGQFNEVALSVCAVVCRNNTVCVTGGPSVVSQTWHVGSAAITQTISYYCQKVLVNGQ